MLCNGSCRDGHERSPRDVGWVERCRRAQRAKAQAIPINSIRSRDGFRRLNASCELHRPAEANKNAHKAISVRTNFPNPINLICPVQPSPRKYTSSRGPQISRTSPPVPARQEGRIAIVTDVGRNAVDAAAPAALMGSQGGLWPVSDRQRGRRTALKRTAKPCGPGARGWRQVGGGLRSPTGRANRQFAGDGGKTNSSPGERGISRKTIAQGMPECSDCTCMLVCASHTISCTRDRGCSKHPAFPAPS